MPDKPKDKATPPAAASAAAQDFNNPDFQAGLTALLAVYQPILEQQLNLAKNPAELQKQAQAASSRTCAQEFEEAYAMFGRFLNEDTAMRLLPPQARELLGPIDQWRWCLQHILCCLVFGWLVCRWPRTFRGYAYYLYEFWRCVRQVIGNPISDPPTEEQRRDFDTLVKILAEAYKPYLTDQLATVEFPAGVPEEIFSGQIDCFIDDQEACIIFERLLTTEAARALLGEAAFRQHSEQSFFWFCRCWCLCALCLGCCLARARNIQQALLCLYAYWRCLFDCFQPLTCEIIDPTPNECASEQYFPIPNVLGVEIIGTAAGAFCDHYILEWKPAAAPATAYTQTGIVYASPAPVGGPGVCGKVNATLGYLNTAALPVDNDVSVRLSVYAQPGGGGPCIWEVSFEIFRVRVWIDGIEGVQVEDPPGVLIPTAQLKTPNVPSGVVRSFGSCLEIIGRAWVGKCTGREIKRFTLSYQPGFVTNPLVGPWTQFWQVDYLTPLQRKEIQTSDFDLTSYWQYQPIYLGQPPCALPSPPNCGIPKDLLWGTRWWSGRLDPSVPVPPQSFPVTPGGDPGPPVVALPWTSTQLPLVNCQSGQYTILLDVEDTTSVHFYDLQQVWFDNKLIYGKMTQVAGVPACSTLNLSAFAAFGGDCTNPWAADLLGIAYDEFILEGDGSIPSDNYAMVSGVVQGGYALWIKKDGAPDPGVPIPIPGPGSPPWTAGPFQGTQRVGDPGTRCATASPPPGFVPPETPGVLAQFDMRRLDACCNPAEPGLTLKRGECCGYVVTLSVWDNSVVPCATTGRHQIDHHFPLCVCNDLPPMEGC
jgi:hypothetical protein